VVIRIALKKGGYIQPLLGLADLTHLGKIPPDFLFKQFAVDRLIEIIVAPDSSALVRRLSDGRRHRNDRNARMRLSARI
jgi:hypothetical protein